MKQSATNSVDQFKRCVKAAGLCLMLAAGSISVTFAQRYQPSDIIGSAAAASANERNPNTNPVRNNPAPSLLICNGITSVSMVDMGFDKALVEWDNTSDFDLIRFRVTDMSTHGSNIVTIHGTPNPGRYFIQGLSALTTYDIEVQSVCTNGTSSQWTSPLSVTTLQPRFAQNNNDGQQQRNINRLHVSPNPANTTTVISFQVASAGTQNVSISTTTGRDVYKRAFVPTVDKLEIPVDVSSYPPGVYVVKVSSAAGTSVERLIVQ